MKLIVPPPVQGVIAALLMWGIAAAMPGLGFGFPGQTVLAIVLIAVGVAIEVVAVGTFFKRRTTVNPMTPQKAKHLVVTGLFRFSRNPMYLGLLIALSGFAIWLGNPLNVIVLAAYVVYITAFQIKPEEAILRDRFGDDYAAYTRRVRRWI